MSRTTVKENSFTEDSVRSYVADVLYSTLESSEKKLAGNVENLKKKSLNNVLKKRILSFYTITLDLHIISTHL